MRTLFFKLEPLDRPPAGAGTFIVVRPEENGDGRYCHNSHLGRRVIEAEVGDVLIHNLHQYRVVAVRRFGDWSGPWFNSVAECLENCQKQTWAEAPISEGTDPVEDANLDNFDCITLDWLEWHN